MTMASAKELSSRAKAILIAIVETYLQTGEPVGSKTISEKPDIGISSASVRHVMSELTAAELVYQPHASAGRIPTALAIRYFLNVVPRKKSLARKDKQRMLKVRSDNTDIELVLRRTSEVVSEITQCAAIVFAPSWSAQRLRRITFVPLNDSRYLCVLMTLDGFVQHRLIDHSVALSTQELAHVHNYLENLLEGKSLTEVRRTVFTERQTDKSNYDRVVAAGLELSSLALTSGSGDTVDGDVYISGTANLLDDTVQEVKVLKRRRDLLQALETKEILIALLDQTIAAKRLRVYLGQETHLDLLEDTSVIAMPYGGVERGFGAVAVMGSTRMNYSRAMSVVDFAAELVSDAIGQAS